jgi:hypothetical protein
MLRGSVNLTGSSSRGDVRPAEVAAKYQEALRGSWGGGKYTVARHRQGNAPPHSLHVFWRPTLIKTKVCAGIRTDI